MRKAGLVTIISLTCYLALMLGITQWQSDGLGFDTDPMSLIRPLAIYLSFYAVMCIEILFSAAFRLIKAGPEQIESPIASIAVSARSQSFVLGLLVSPIVFAAIASQFETQTNILPSILLSFQNGFFWENIFRKAGEPS